MPSLMYLVRKILLNMVVKKQKKERYLNFLKIIIVS
jgi:hypothetical protein